MNKINFILTLPILLLLLAGCNNQIEQQKIIVLKGGTVFDGTGKSIEKSVITIKDNRIQTIGDDDIKVPNGAEIIDVSGKFITPGMVDAHIHFCQTGFFDARPDAADLRDSISYFDVQAFQKSQPERYYKSYLNSGVTAVYDVGGFPWSIELQESAEKNLDAPHIAASGSLLTPAPEKLISIFNTESENVMVHFASAETGINMVKQNSNLGSTGIKIWGMSPKNPSFMEDIKAVADEIEKQGNKLIVHATSLDEAKAALKNKAKLLVHSVRDTLVDEEFIELIKHNNAIYTPTLLVRRGSYKAYRALSGEGFMINDPNNVLDRKTKNLIEGAENFQKFIDIEWLQNELDRYEVNLAKEDSVETMNLKRLFDSGTLIAVGTDAGNPGTLHGISFFDELEAMQAAGIPADQLIIMATRNGAMAMERINDFGTLEVGKMADLVILENDPSENISNMRSITHVMRGGLLRSVKEKSN
jgi:imidazolonepropionase-like amidohydrolase